MDWSGHVRVHSLEGEAGGMGRWPWAWGYLASGILQLGRFDGRWWRRYCAALCQASAFRISASAIAFCFLASLVRSSASGAKRASRPLQ